MRGPTGRAPDDLRRDRGPFHHADDRVGAIIAKGRKGALAALREAQMIETMYAFGPRRRELVHLAIADLRSIAKAKQWARVGSAQDPRTHRPNTLSTLSAREVRIGKSVI